MNTKTTFTITTHFDQVFFFLGGDFFLFFQDPVLYREDIKPRNSFFSPLLERKAETRL